MLVGGTWTYSGPSSRYFATNCSVLRGKGAYFNDLRNTINFIKNRAEVAYIPYINCLNLFILLDNPVQPRLTVVFLSFANFLISRLCNGTL
jgi:hypothetical protein